MHISSDEHGTTVTIDLPLHTEAKWFATHILLKSESTLIVVDDDQSIHDLWSDRVSNLRINILHFHSLEAFQEWFSTSGAPNQKYLIDYEFAGTQRSGLDVVQLLGIEEDSLIVTSHSNDKDLQDRVIKANTKMLPKDIAAIIPVQITT